MSISFTINGKRYDVNSKQTPLSTSLNTFIRVNAHLKGTKFMCLEGGCGVCIVTVKGIHPVTKEKKTWAVNSCLFPVFSCHGLEIITVEALGNARDGYHPIQDRLAHFNGSQCGFCTPGMVMNMYSMLESNDDRVSMADIENSFGGNICRCTGYRPILDAFKSLATDSDQLYDGFCNDIEDLGKKCPKTGTRCAGMCGSSMSTELHDEKNVWYNVTTLDEVFDKLKTVGSRKYTFLAGNTAHGVYRRDPEISVFINLRGVKELQSHSIAKEIILGANVTLNEMMEILAKAANTNRNFRYCSHLVNHIDLVANVSVRNIGTIAGNLSIKHQNNSFPSDIFLILETVGARIKIAESTLIVKEYQIKDFLKVDMNKKLIMSISLPGYDPSKFIYRSYKIMPRAQNTHAHVNAAILANIERGVIKSIRICYGGICPDFIHATQTEELLAGRDLYTDDNLRAALESLEDEIRPDWVLPETSIEYRKYLAIALFYKFVLNTCPKERLKAEYKSGGELLKRPISTGQQTFDTNESRWPITKPITKSDLLIQSSGEAEFVNDIPNLPNELWAALVPATKVHYNIAKIDPSEALAIPGVHAFYSAKDIPGENNFADSKLYLLPVEEEIFCGGEVLYHSQPAGIILADSFEKAHHAATKVKIMYTMITRNKSSTTGNNLSHDNDDYCADDKVTVIPTIKEAIELKANDRFLEIIEVNELKSRPAVKNADNIKGYFQMNGQYHYTMETLTTFCIPSDDGLHVYTTTQWIDSALTAVAKATKLKESAITMEVKRLGGGYGTKMTRASFSAAACAVASVLSNRPVRFVMSIEENMSAIGKRSPCYCNYDVDHDKNGKILNVNNEYSSDGGCSMNESFVNFINTFFGNVYDRQYWHTVGSTVVTDSASNTRCRAPGSTESIGMTETIIEHVAWSVGKDPADVRMLNMKDDQYVKKITPGFLKDIDYKQRRAEIDEFNKKNRWVKRGIAISPMQFNVAYLSSLSALVAIYHVDGSVAISHGGVDMGQGINTKIVQVASKTLGIPMDCIKIKPTNSLCTANSFYSGGSRTTDMNCFAVFKACEELNKRLQPIKDEMKGASWADIVHAAHEKFVDLTVRYMFKQPDLNPYLVYGISCCEIKVDLLTGLSQLVRVDILEDTGESLNPLIDIGQIEGAFIMGIGLWLSERLVYHRETGELLTNRTWDYNPPGVKDIPIDFRVNLIQKNPNPLFVLRSKAASEPAVCMAIVTLFALRHALNSARSDAGVNEWYHLGGPTTIEEVFLNSKLSIDQFKLSS